MAFKYRPDQIDCGWAWVVVAASFFAHFITFGIAWTTGIYHVIFLEEFRSSQGVTAWAGSLMPAAMFAAGPFASLLLNKLGCRVTMVIGGLTSSSGLILSYFAPNIIVLYLTFGLITGSMYDMTGNYITSFVTGGASLILSSLFMILPLRYKDVASNSGVSIRVKCHRSVSSPLTTPIDVDIDDVTEKLNNDSTQEQTSRMRLKEDKTEDKEICSDC